MFDIEHAHNAYDPKTVWDKHFDEFIVRHYHDGEFGSPEWFNKENIINELGFVDDDGVYRFNFCPCTEVGKERIHEVILSQWFFSRVWRSRQKGLPTRHDTKLEYVLTYSFNYFGSVVAEMDLWFDKPQAVEGLGFGGALLRGVSDATLSKHVKALVGAGYLESRKSASPMRDDSRRVVWLSLTEEGRRAFDGHVRALEEIVGPGS